MIVLRELARWLPHLSEGWRRALEWSDWALAATWCVRTRTLMNRLREVPDLTETRWDLCPVASPGLVVVVPARDEADTLPAAMQTLMDQDYPWLRVIAVDDRSTDGTGELLEGIAAQNTGRLSVIHITELTEGWIAKTFAMEVAASRSRSEWLLFTDADVWFSPSILRRALAYAEMSQADHLVVAPSAMVKGWGESVVLGFFSLFVLWASRPWRVSDPKATWDFAGAGAFNLIRREAWEELGGFAPQRLAVVEDLTLARRVRAAGMRQRLVFAPGLVLVHWATGAKGLIRVVTKNLFAAVNFRLWMASGFELFVLAVFLAPLGGLFWWRTLVPSVLVVACVGAQYRAMGEVTGIEARWAWLYPFGAAALCWAMLRSAAVTLWRGGVRWRDTFYPLSELRRHNSPFTWEWQAARERAERRKMERSVHPNRAVRLADKLRGRSRRQRTAGRPR